MKGKFVFSDYFEYVVNFEYYVSFPPSFLSLFSNSAMWVIGRWQFYGSLFYWFLGRKLLKRLKSGFQKRVHQIQKAFESWIRPLCPVWIDTLRVVNYAKLNILGWARSQLVLIVEYLYFICRLEPCIGWHNCYKIFLTFCYKSLDRGRKMEYFRMNHE